MLRLATLNITPRHRASGNYTGSTSRFQRWKRGTIVIDPAAKQDSARAHFHSMVRTHRHTDRNCLAENGGALFGTSSSSCNEANGQDFAACLSISIPAWCRPGSILRGHVADHTDAPTAGQPSRLRLTIAGAATMHSYSTRVWRRRS